MSSSSSSAAASAKSPALAARPEANGSSGNGASKPPTAHRRNASSTSSKPGAILSGINASTFHPQPGGAAPVPPPPPANHINVANQFSVANQFAAAANQYAGAPNGSVPPMHDGPSAAAVAAASTGATPPGHKPNDATCIGCVAERLIATTRCELAASRDWCRRYCDYRSHGTSQESLTLFHEDRQRLAHIERVLGLGQAAWDIKSIETLQGVRDSSSLAQALLTVMGLLVARVDALEKEKMKLEQEKLSTAVAQSARDRQMQDFAAMLQSTREELRLARVKTGELEGRILRMEAHSRGGAPAPAYPLFTDKRPHSAMAATTTAPSHPQTTVALNGNGNGNGESANTNGSHNAAATAKRPAASEEERTTGDTPQPPRKRIALCPPLLTVPLPPASTSSVLNTNGHPRSAGEAPTTRNPIIASPGPPLLPASFTFEQAASHLAQLRKQIRTPASFLRHTKVSDDEPVSRELQRPQSVPPIMALPRPQQQQQQQQQPGLPVTPTRLTSSRLASTPAPSAISRAVSPSPLKVGLLPTEASKEAPTENELGSNHPTSSSSVQVGPFPQPSEKERGHEDGQRGQEQAQSQERPQSPSSRLAAAAAAKAAGGDGESNGNGSHKGAKGKAKAAAAEARVEGSIDRQAPQKRSSLAL